MRLNDLRLKTADLSGFRCPVGFAQSGGCKSELAVDSAEHLIGGGGLSLMIELQP